MACFRVMVFSCIVFFSCESGFGLRRSSKTTKEKVMQSQERQLLTRRSDEMEEEMQLESQECCKKLKKKAKKAVKSTKKTVNKIGKDIGKGVVNVGDTVSDLGEKVGDQVADGAIFAFEALQGLAFALFGNMRWKLLAARGGMLKPIDMSDKLCVGSSGKFTICRDGDEKTKFDIESKKEGGPTLFKAVRGGNYINVKSSYQASDDPVFQSGSDDSGSQWKIEDGPFKSISLRSERSGRYLQAKGSSVTQRSSLDEDSWPEAYWYIHCEEAPGSCKKWMKSLS